MTWKEREALCSALLVSGVADYNEVPWEKDFRALSPRLGVETSRLALSENLLFSPYQWRSLHIFIRKLSSSFV